MSRLRFSQLTVLALALAASLAVVVPSSAFARATRPYESSFGSSTYFGTEQSHAPGTLAVDQSDGDVYVGGQGTVSRFSATGQPQNFSEGPGAGTNSIGFSSSTPEVAVDNSAGPLSGDFYVVNAAGVAKGSVQVFSPSGAALGAVVGSGVDTGRFSFPCGVAVDQSTGDLYVAERNGFNGDFDTEITPHPGEVFRYAPVAPSGAIDDADYAYLGAITAPEACQLAADAGNVYVIRGGQVAGRKGQGELFRYAASDFAPNAPEADGTKLASDVSAVAVDPETGELYADEGDAVTVLGSSGESLYRFGAAAYFGTASAGVAVKSATSGPASTVYVADPTAEHQVDVFGEPSVAPTYAHRSLATFGPDGTSATTFDGLDRIAFETSSQSLYALTARQGIYGFDASVPPTYSPLSSFPPLPTANLSTVAGLAVDSTALASAGNVYLASRTTNLLYGWDSNGAPLANFPVDPASTPGAPDGSPAELCGAAVDPDGDIWISNVATGKILEYGPGGSLLPGEIDTSSEGAHPCQLAFDTNGDLYVAFQGTGGVVKYTAASAYTIAAKIGAASLNAPSLAVNPSDHHVYVAYPKGPDQVGTWIDEYDAGGNLISEFATGISGAGFNGIAVDPTAHEVYVADGGNGVLRAFGPAILLPEAAAATATALAATSATLNGKVNDQGVALSECHFEYVTEAAFKATGFDDLSSGGSAPCAPAADSIPIDLRDHSVSGSATGLTASTTYYFRLVAGNAGSTTNSAAARFTSAGPPLVETTGSALRTTVTAQFQGRVDPSRAPAHFHFEYLEQATYEEDLAAHGPGHAFDHATRAPVAASEDPSIGAADAWRLVSQRVSGLAPATTYRYRLVADNGSPGGSVYGTGMALTTRASEAPLSHGHFPGPPGSDRAWEQVSLPDSGGNPVQTAYGFSDSGDRAGYGIRGGTPIGPSGTLQNVYYAERPSGAHPESGWRTTSVTPPRAEARASWPQVIASDDLASLVARNDEQGQPDSIWRLNTAGSPEELLQTEPPEKLTDFVGNNTDNLYTISSDAARVVAVLEGGDPDPANPAAGSVPNVYDISAGATHLLSLLPGNTAAACGVGGKGVFEANGAQITRWLSADGSLLVFPSKGNDCNGSSQLYLRDLTAGQTRLISGPPLSGPTCEATLIQATPGAVFLASQSRLSSADTEGAGCSGDNDVYRYDIADHSLSCLTCRGAGVEANVEEARVAEDGARLYFTTTSPLLPGAGEERSLYRLDVANQALAYVAPFRSSLDRTGFELTPDGSELFFYSGSAWLNPVGGTTNFGISQAYLYQDDDRALTCVSCPRDGSAPLGVAIGHSEGEPNLGSLSAGGTVVFATPTPLVDSDQNTPNGGNPKSGTDIYEWRDGRLFLVTDGLTEWSLNAEPQVQGITPSGRDLFFSAPAQYTADALDSYSRLYDARIGGGIAFPPEATPCALEVCQGSPKRPFEEQSPGSSSYSGPGNAETHSVRPRRACPKGKRRSGRRADAHCVKRHHRKKSGARRTKRRKRHHQKNHRAHVERRAHR